MVMWFMIHVQLLNLSSFEFLRVPSSSFEFLRGNFVINGEIVEVHPKKKV